MILLALAAFGIGLAQRGLVSFQIRLLAAGHRGLRVFVVSCAISAVWCLGVHSVVADPIAAPCFVLGAAVGTVLAARVRLSRAGAMTED